MSGPPSGARRVEHSRTLMGPRRGTPGSAGSRRRKQLAEAQAFAARDDLDSFVSSCTSAKPPRRPSSGHGQLGKMEMQDIAEAKDDDEYTEAEMQEIERNQQKLADSFEESNAECDRMLAAASSSSNEIEQLAEEITRLSSRISQGAPETAAASADAGDSGSSGGGGSGFSVNSSVNRADELFAAIDAGGSGSARGKGSKGRSNGKPRRGR